MKKLLLLPILAIISHSYTLQENNNKNIIKISSEFIYNIDNHTLLYNDTNIHLTRKEILLLDLLCKNINQTVSYETLVDYIWQNKDIASSTIRDTVSRLKKKVPTLDIDNISNYGYSLRSS
jgi:DNA-binding response OmpR family regulator